MDEALAALLARYRAAEVDAIDVAYDEHPLDEPDGWGDRAPFRRAVGDECQHRLPDRVADETHRVGRRG